MNAFILYAFNLLYILWALQIMISYNFLHWRVNFNFVSFNSWNSDEYLQYWASTHMWKWQACKKLYLRKFWNSLGLAWWGNWAEEDHPRDTIQLTPTPFLFKFRRVSYGSAKLVNRQLKCKSSSFFSFFRYVLPLLCTIKTTCSMRASKSDPAFYVRWLTMFLNVNLNGG